MREEAFPRDVRPLIIGTAGHVDHGKTALVRRLTGHDTDRLPEEKRRGISIELGFAPFLLPSGRRAAIVDVPGHERFIRHMLAGATGMDLVLLVVAADEGVMPQTREHLDILTLIGVRSGAIVVTKIDLVEREWLPLVEEEVREAVSGSFLEGSPVFPVSSETGEGIPALLAFLDEQVARLPPRSAEGPVRLPVDRAFVVAGFGTVVTGTLHRGVVRVDDRLVVVPGEKPVRVRGIQVHGEPREAARAGERVALNLSGVERQEVGMGAQVVAPGSLRPTDTLYTLVRVLKDATPLRHGEHLVLHALTFHVPVQAVLLEGDEVPPGGEGLVRLKLAEAAWLEAGDVFVLRRISPSRTMGGGRVLATEGRFRRRNEEDLALLREMAEENPERRLLAKVRRRLAVPYSEEVAKALREAGVGTLQAGDLLVRTEELEARLVRAWEELRASRYHLGFPREILRQRFFPEVDTRSFSALVEELIRMGRLVEERGLLHPPGEQVQLSEEEKARLSAFLAEMRRALFQPPTQEEAEARLGAPLIGLLLEEGRLVRIGEFLFLDEALKEAERRLLEYFKTEKELPMSAFRDLLGTSRRFAVPLLEYFDSRRLTRRQGDVRVLASPLPPAGGEDGGGREAT